MAEPSAQAQATEEAEDWRAGYQSEVVKAALDLAAMLALHVPPDFPPSELARRLALSLDRVSRERERLALERAAAAEARLKYADQLTIDSARAVIDASDNPAVILWGPGMPGERGYASIDLEPEPDEEGNFGAVLRYTGPRGAPIEAVGIKTLADLYVELKRAILAIRAARAALEESK